ncbi:hypothetical protein QFZ60_001561 [Arthrobacter sp. B2I5]|uniref:hypothetical protein n=1 Tax=Arthrobacter sp. B2I5 TaxID=3042266 RepID=UPI00277D4083|nr:hypothetical protein [Arthrobacter sp. B2I5]MDQ0825388.1 hypothetical protein [Arthrobacter sp. B2I5]
MNTPQRRPAQWGRKELQPFSGKARKEELQALKELKKRLHTKASLATLLIEGLKASNPWYGERVDTLIAKTEAKEAAKQPKL